MLLFVEGENVKRAACFVMMIFGEFEKEFF